MAEISLTRSDGLPALFARWRGFAAWWRSELRKAVPAAWLKWIDRDACPRLLIWRDGDLAVCQLASASGPMETQIPLDRFSAADITAWLAECGLSRDQVMTGPLLNPQLFLQRDLALPKAALAALPKILEQDVLRRTPFQLPDIWHAAVPANVAAEPAAADVLPMRHWIIRRDRADAALAELRLQICDVDFLAVCDDAGEGVPVIPFRQAGQEDPPWARRAIRLLAAAAAAAVVVGLVAFEWCQSSVATRIEASLAEARNQAQGSIANGGIDQIARLFAMKADVGVLDVWDELSSVLPDHTFLTETRIADGNVVISGFSADAARLVRLIDQSPLFTGARLSAAITPDATEHKDRFSVSFKLRDGRSWRPSPNAAIARSDPS